MANRIRAVHVVNHRLDPHETELRIHVELDEVTPTMQIKGRLMGPRNVYASTVEVAYPMREVERGQGIVLRVVIPEPSWWEPKTPFLYQGPLELWQDGHLCERREIRHGIHRVQLTSNGVLLNGKAMVLRGKIVDDQLTPRDCISLHDAGVNLLMSSWNETLADLADRHGLFLLANCNDLPERQFLRHPSTFGWILPEEALGYLVESASGHACRCVIFFLWQLDDLPKPDLRTGKKIVLAQRLPDPFPSRPDVIGWIESP